MKKLIKWLQRWDLVWSVPLAFIGFVLFPYMGQAIFGEGMGFYSPEFFHAAIYAALLMIFFNGVIQLGIYFNFDFLLDPLDKDRFIGVYFLFMITLVFVWSRIV